MTKYEGQEQGPSWYDVHEATERIQARYALVVVFRTVFYPAGKSSHRSASVVAEVRTSTAATATVRAMGVAQFRGNGGARTMPAAMWLALSAAEDKLDAKVSKAEQAAMF